MKALRTDGVQRRFVGMGVASLLVSAVIMYTIFRMPDIPAFFSRCLTPSINIKKVVPMVELGKVLDKAAMKNRTLIISVLNEAYAEDGGMLDLFLGSLRHGEDTERLIKHLVLVAVDQTSFERCTSLGLYCFQLTTEESQLSNEVMYMSDGFIEMMWQRIHFLGEVLKRGYNFIFTDMDVMWLRNPFVKLNHPGDDLQISCDKYNGRPLDDSNYINTGFYFVKSNNRTIALYDEWYASRNTSVGMKEQDVLSQMKSEGSFGRLGIKVRYLNTLYFSGFCPSKRNFKRVCTVHANCCLSIKAKITDLTEFLEVWKRFNGTTKPEWPAHKACSEAWKKDALSKVELGRALTSASMENNTVIVSVLNKAYVEENGMLDLFLRSLKQGEDTEFLIKHFILVAMDQIAFDRCKLLNLNCYRLVANDIDFSKEQLYMTDGFINMMWQRTHFLGEILKRGYNIIFTDMDVIWLRNPLTKLSNEGEDMQLSCDWYTGEPFDNTNRINTGFYYVASNNKTIALFDAWYKAKSKFTGMKEQDVLSEMKSAGIFTQLGLRVRYLDTFYFSGFCQTIRDIRQVVTVHANCCRTVNAKLIDLSNVLEAWGSFNGTTTIKWSGHEACDDSWRHNIIL